MKIRKLIVCFTVLLIFASCSNIGKKEKAEFTLSGTLQGIDSGIITMKAFKSSENMDTAIIENGQFTFKGNFPHLQQVSLSIPDRLAGLYLIAENAHLTLSGHADTLYKAKIHNSPYLDAMSDFFYYLNNPGKDPSSSIKTSKKITSLKDVDSAFRYFSYPKNLPAGDSLIQEYILAHPSRYVFDMMKSFSEDKQVENQKQTFALLPEELKNSYEGKIFFNKLNYDSKSNVSLETFVKDASNINYKVDPLFKGANFKDIAYLSKFDDQTICALTKEKQILFINNKGKLINSLKLDAEGDAATICVDEDEQIHVLTNVKIDTKFKHRGKVSTRKSNSHSNYTLLNSKGEIQKQFRVVGVNNVSGAKIAQGKLFLASSVGRKVIILDPNSEKLVSTINNVRPCCRILDIDISTNNELIVANLGGFSVDVYDSKGDIKFGFGQRGSTINDFHGCCNPVSVASLSNGGVVTVEKSPTRIKVYSKEGASQVEGIEELVKGCNYIPMTVDGKDNLYLASPTKGLIKCVTNS